MIHHFFQHAAHTKGLLPLLLASCAFAAPLARAGEFLFMPTITLARENPSIENRNLDNQKYIADLFYAGDWDRFRFLGELQLEPRDANLKRLQIGWRVTPEASIWLGRFLNPIGYWNPELIHGHYMATSVTRPRIIDFEDDAGPMPTHLTGLLLQGTHSRGEGGWQYDFAIGSGPRLAGQLVPVDVLRGSRLNKLALVARLAFRPDVTRDSQYGVSLAHTRIPAEDQDFKEFEQSLAGVYLNQEFDRLRVFGELFRVTHRVTRGEGTLPSYWAGYLQAEYKLIPSVWTAYARYEGISSPLDDDYRSLFPRLYRQGYAGGVRWDFKDNQALKLELFRNVSFDQTRSNGFAIQWAALFQ